nr:SymE family type I addiction module toxin [Escherichia marmotae]
MLPAQYLTSHNDTPVIKISAKWLREAGFEIGTGVTVKISEGCLILLADNNEVRKRLVRTVLIFTESSDQLSRATDRVPGLPASPGYVQ